MVLGNQGIRESGLLPTKSAESGIAPDSLISDGIVYDGTHLRFMTDTEIEQYVQHALPTALIVIVPPRPVRTVVDASQ